MPWKLVMRTSAIIITTPVASSWPMNFFITEMVTMSSLRPTKKRIIQPASSCCTPLPRGAKMVKHGGVYEFERRGRVRRYLWKMVAQRRSSYGLAIGLGAVAFRSDDDVFERKFIIVQQENLPR
nr:hypothetical protein [Tanacetum cinerariifolium]